MHSYYQTSVPRNSRGTHSFAVESLLHLIVMVRIKVKAYIGDTQRVKGIMYFLVYTGIILRLSIILKNELGMVRHACNPVLGG